jgi:deoxyribonuclease-4
MTSRTARVPPPCGTDRLLGAHLSTAGGWELMLAKARTLGCRAVQIFAANPRAWAGSPVSRVAAERYRALAPRYGVRALVVHAIYLVNLASPDARLAARSARAVRRDLVSAGRLGARAFVLHPGSDLGVPGGEARLRKRLRALLPAVPAGTRLLLEGMAGTRHSLGSLAVLGRLARALGPRVGVCLDSAHLCASGYRLDDPAGFRRLDRDLRRWVGIRRIGCIHLNDSAQPCGSRRDHHANLGEGHVGRAGLTRCLAHPPFARLPFILETPGFDQQGPDARNLARARAYLRAAGRS